MALSVDWIAKIITVPRADMVLVQAAPEIRELDIDAFRLELKDLEDDEGMPFLDTHRHNTEVVLSGVTYARIVEIINGYTIEFEDGQYAVNLVGANSNIADVAVVNQVSIRSFNSAGLVNTGLGALLHSNVLLDSTVATQVDSTHVSLTTGPTDDDFYKWQSITFEDQSGDRVQRWILDYVGATRTVTIDESLPVGYTLVAGDKATITKDSYKAVGLAEADERLTNTQRQLFERGTQGAIGENVLLDQSVSGSQLPAGTDITVKS